MSQILRQRRILVVAIAAVALLAGPGVAAKASAGGLAAAAPAPTTAAASSPAVASDLLGGFEAIVVGLGAVIPYAVLLAVVALAARYGARAATRVHRRPRAEREAS
jgi:hypothetical protein